MLIGIPDPESLGGPAACEPPFIAELRKQHVHVDEEIYVYGDKLSRTSSAARVRRVLTSAFRLRAKLRRDNFDLVHLNSSFDRRAILRDVSTLAILGNRPRVFIKFHGSDVDLLKTEHPALKKSVRRLLNRVDGIGLLSTEEKTNFLNAGWPDKKLFVVKNVVERAFPPADPEFNARHGFKPGVPTLLFIGRFIPAKGLLDVIPACALLRDRGTDFGLICVGDGPSRDEAEAEVERRLLNDRVSFTGYLSEDKTAEYYVNCSALVFPTYHYEGFPMTIFYAVAAGKPIITTRIRAAADYLSEPQNCLWVEPRNPEMLADRIQLLIENPQLRLTMARENQKLAREFSAAMVTNEYLAAYRKVIAATRADDAESKVLPAHKAK
ncbi:MAG TPA: glycosyltransferase family 4 protein [Pyrinomonadaceae bacterium]|nr:glycosyltransferase family 4 protein [Pyrinomonadaceae bacterium]